MVNVAKCYKGNANDVTLSHVTCDVLMKESGQKMQEELCIATYRKGLHFQRELSNDHVIILLEKFSG